ncbi:DUF3473 domain-containing protein [Geomonas nitrogeniifigens]|uniref:DUF3473 domain-containing protein n=1 Tax=Geomonas diazotrophica TaxID=2843197 RepID=A0ABX8JBV9_9BACT|nr:XrtA system polysaccharide deacetylase [Geomonas nitrogeniifigens]QWV95855.1 DUF3473 domain-containing protein [Geomonas nitrogeniifigens]QXE84940.1 DUF3473 domain-containing protein [Geomonas nitrogeniifigens]
MKVVNALTVDVEDYFQVSAFEGCVDRDRWDDYPLRVERNTRRILELLEKRGIRGTFFVLGWVARRCPDLVREIRRAGHEVACHGYGHQRVNRLGRTAFRDDIRVSKALLEDLTGEAVLGYRAPSYSIAHGTPWAFDELAEAGYRYDSSVFPVRHDLYGIPDWPRFPFLLRRGTERWEPVPGESPILFGGESGDDLVEFPITTLSLFGMGIPIAGGGYFRFFPYGFTKWGLNRINSGEGRPFVFYLHPWELDPEQPRMAGAGAKSRFRHYLNLDKTQARLVRLLGDFGFGRLCDLLDAPA